MKTIFCAICLLVLFGCKDSLPVETPMVVKYKQAGASVGSAFGENYFVSVDLSNADNATSYKELESIAHKLCKKKVCFVHYWDDESLAAKAIPMSDAETNSMIASYRVVKDSGSSKFQCHPFADDGQRCATN